MRSRFLTPVSKASTTTTTSAQHHISLPQHPRHLSLSTMPIAFVCKSYRVEPLEREHLFMDPFGDFKSFESWDNLIRHAGAREASGPKRKGNILNTDGEVELLYDLAQILENDLWWSQRVKFKLRKDRKSKEVAENPRLTEWMREDVSGGRRDMAKQTQPYSSSPKASSDPDIMSSSLSTSFAFPFPFPFPWSTSTSTSTSMLRSSSS